MGCLEVRCSSDLAIPLFLVSSYVTTDFVSTLIFPLGNAIVTAETLGIWAVQVKSSLPPKDARGQQHVWNRALIEKKWDNLSKLPLLWLRLISSQPSDDPNPSCIGFDNHPRTPISKFCYHCDDTKLLCPLQFLFNRGMATYLGNERENSRVSSLSWKAIQIPCVRRQCGADDCCVGRF